MLVFCPSQMWGVKTLNIIPWCSTDLEKSVISQTHENLSAADRQRLIVSNMLLFDWVWKRSDTIVPTPVDGTC